MKRISTVAILELVINQAYYDQLVVNRFHYVSGGTPAAVSLSFALTSAAGFIPATPITATFPGGTLADKMEAIVSEDLVFVSAYARNLYSVTDFYEVPYATTILGDTTGEACSPALAYGLFSSRVRTDIRRGMKRFAGVSEAALNGGGIITSGMLANLVLLADKMSEVITYDDEGNTLSFTPAVLGLQEYTTPKGKRAYRIYATESAQLAKTAQGIAWSPYAKVRTQVSRQYGRGV